MSPALLATIANIIAAPIAAHAMTTVRPACTGEKPIATGTATAVENPGGKCASGAVESAAVQLLVGIRYVPSRTSDAAAPRYDIASGSSPGPGGSVAIATTVPTTSAATHAPTATRLADRRAAPA